MKLDEGLFRYVNSYLVDNNWQKRYHHRWEWALWIITIYHCRLSLLIADSATSATAFRSRLRWSIIPLLQILMHKCPGVPFCSNWMLIPSCCIKAINCSVYSREENEMQDQQMEIIVSIKNTSLLHRLKGIIKHMSPSKENISTKAFNMLIFSWTSHDVTRMLCWNFGLGFERSFHSWTGAPAASLLADLVAFEIRFRFLDKREAILADPDRCSAISDFIPYAFTYFLSLHSSDAILTHPKRLGRFVFGRDVREL